jgi:hypothetical protein
VNCCSTNYLVNKLIIVFATLAIVGTASLLVIVIVIDLVAANWKLMMYRIIICILCGSIRGGLAGAFHRFSLQ